MKNKLSSTYIMSLFVALLFTCVSCSHTRSGSALEGGLSEASQEEGSNDVASSEGSTDGKEEVSEAAADKAQTILGVSDQESLEATGTPGEQRDISQLGTNESKPELMNSPVLTDNSDTVGGALAVPTTPEASTEKIFAPKKKSVGKRHINKPAAAETTRPAETSPTSEAAPAPKPAETASVGAEVDEALGHDAIPEPEKGVKEPELASTEISGFIERHVFLVTVCVVGFVFALFVALRRNRHKEESM
jgi:hypothetical protein